MSSIQQLLSGSADQVQIDFTQLLRDELSKHVRVTIKEGLGELLKYFTTNLHFLQTNAMKTMTQQFGECYNILKTFEITRRYKWMFRLFFVRRDF